MLAVLAHFSGDSLKVLWLFLFALCSAPFLLCAGRKPQNHLIAKSLCPSPGPHPQSAEHAEWDPHPCTPPHCLGLHCGRTQSIRSNGRGLPPCRGQERYSHTQLHFTCFTSFTKTSGGRRSCPISQVRKLRCREIKKLREFIK